MNCMLRSKVVVLVAVIDAVETCFDTEQPQDSYECFELSQESGWSRISLLVSRTPSLTRTQSNIHRCYQQKNDLSIRIASIIKKEVDIPSMIRSGNFIETL